MPYAKHEFAVIRNGAIVSLGPAVNEAGAKAYAKRQGLKLVWRSVSEWLEMGDKA